MPARIQKQRVLIADDHLIFRQALRSLLSSEEILEVIGEAADGLELVHLALKLKPDMILLDICMPRANGIQALAELRKCSAAEVIILAAHDDEEYVLNAFQLGAKAYVLKDVAYSELLFAIQTVAKGKYYISPRVCGEIIRNYLESKRCSAGPIVTKG